MELVRPSELYRETFIEGLTESHAEEKFLFWKLEDLQRGFSGFVQGLLDKETLCPVARVPESLFWAILDSALTYHLLNSAENFL